VSESSNLSNPRDDDVAEGSCCAPARGTAHDGTEAGDAAPAASLSDTGGAVVSAIDFVDIPAGTFTMGSDAPSRWPGDGEGPQRRITLDAYRIARHTVTNDQFAAFVRATGHVTDAERYGWTFVFHLFLPDDFPPTRAVAAAPWWRQVEGGDWSHPFGPQSDLTDLGDHPVVHLSWNDAQAFCAWAGVRLATEAEWERAARGGLDGARYPWGDEFAPGGTTMCNIFEGEFPISNTAADGYVGTAPVDAFAPNGFGLHHMAGNVWEWCADWFSPRHSAAAAANPTGPSTGSQRVMRGGSYLCHDSYCDRYRVVARTSNEPDSSTGNLGFRVVADAVRRNSSVVDPHRRAQGEEAPAPDQVHDGVRHANTAV